MALGHAALTKVLVRVRVRVYKLLIFITVFRESQNFDPNRKICVVLLPNFHFVFVKFYEVIVKWTK